MDHQFFRKLFCLVIFVSLSLSSCTQLSPTVATTEFITNSAPVSAEAVTETPPPVSTNAPEATEAPVSILKVNPVPAEFLFDGVVEKAFNDGEYADGMQTIAEWVKIWEEMGVFEGEQFNGDSLNPVPLKGIGRFVCVDTLGQGKKFKGMLLCAPLDLVNGGLRPVPASGQWTEADRPLLITFEGTEELTTKGTDKNSVYQFQDKYQGKATRYFDPVTGEIVAGKTTVKDVEVEGNEVVEGSIVCVSNEYCMGGQMEVDQEAGKVFYDRFMDALIHSEANEKYFNDLLDGNVTLDSFKAYLEANNGVVPPGLKMMRSAGAQYMSMSATLDKPVNLSALKTVVFGSKEWQSNASNIQEYIGDYDKVGLMDPLAQDVGYSMIYYGWMVDEGGYLVFVCGSKDPKIEVSANFPNPYSIIGDKDGEYVPERDNKFATAYVLSLVTFMEKLKNVSTAGVVPLPDREGNLGAYEKDVKEFFGGRLLFK